MPGTGIDRYTLRVLIATTGRHEHDRVELWQAYDPVLDRPVAMRILRADHPRAERLTIAARAAATVDERHLVHVLDVLDRVRVEGTAECGPADYVVIVHEWSSGATLADIFEQREGEPLDVADALDLARQVAVALAAAHRMGVAHQRIRPGALLITGSTAPDGDGEVRVRGLAVDAALWEPLQAGPGVDLDVHGIGCLLYTAVTARWPGGLADGVSGAPTHAGALLPPSHVRAEVPTWVDQICARAIDPALWGDATARGKGASQPPFADVDALLAALGAPAEHNEPPRRLALAGSRTNTVVTATAPAVQLATKPGRGSRVLHRTLGIAAAVAIMGGLGAGGWQLITNAPSPWGTTAQALPTEVLTYVGEASPSAITDYSAGVLPGQLTPTAVVSFDPFGTDGAENPDLVEAAVDGNPVTAWLTETYFSQDLGSKEGVGLIVDLGSASAVSAVRLQLQGVGTSVSVKVGSDPEALPDTWATLAEAAAVGDVIDLRAPRPVVGRYVLVWFTSLPPADGAYIGGIREVAVLSR